MVFDAILTLFFDVLCIAVMEKFTENTRFCLICNYLTKIIPALQSRCTRFRFGPLDNEQMTTRLEHVIKAEGYVCTRSRAVKYYLLVFDMYFYCIACNGDHFGHAV